MEKELKKSALKQQEISKNVFPAVRKNDVTWLQKHFKPELHKQLADQHSQSLLHVASYLGFYESCVFLVDHGVDVNARDKNNWSPLHSAAGGQDRGDPNLQICSFFLKKGADPNATTSSGATALHYLVRYPFTPLLLEVCEFIIAKGGNVDPRDNCGETPLHQASFRGCPEVVDLLVKNGAGLNNMNNGSEVPLHLAARSGKEEVVKMLLRHDADPEVLGKHGNARDIAFVCNHQSIVDFLDEIERENALLYEENIDTGAWEVASGFYSEAPLETVQRYEKSRVSVRLQDANLIASRLLEMEEEEEEAKSLNLSSSSPSSSSSSSNRSLPPPLTPNEAAALLTPRTPPISSTTSLSGLDSPPITPPPSPLSRGRDGGGKKFSASRVVSLQELSSVSCPSGTTELTRRRNPKGRLIISHAEYNQETGGFSEVGKSSQDLQLEYTNEHDDYYFITHFVKNPKEVFEDGTKKCQIPDSSFVNLFHLLGKKDAMTCVVTVRMDAESGNYRAMLRTPVEDLTFWLYAGEVKKPEPKYVAQAVCNRFQTLESVEVVLDMPPLSRLLVDMDLILKIQRYKFGVLYLDKTPETEEDLFQGHEGSPEYRRFLDFLGDRIRLKDWKKYRGDLDVKHDGTGTHSYHTDWYHLEILFQVAHEITSDRRKPIIGNTISTIVFQQSGQFNPSLVRSQVLHVFVVVQPVVSDSGETLYRLGIATKKGVPRYRPSLPRPSVFRLDHTFREVLLTKLVNGERASYHCSTKVRTQKRSLVELTQMTRKGQMDYALSQIKTKPLKIQGPKSATAYLEHVAEKPKARSRAGSLPTHKLKPRQNTKSKTSLSISGTSTNSKNG